MREDDCDCTRNLLRTRISPKPVFPVLGTITSPALPVADGRLKAERYQTEPVCALPEYESPDTTSLLGIITIISADRRLLNSPKSISELLFDPAVNLLRLRRLRVLLHLCL